VSATPIAKSSIPKLLDLLQYRRQVNGKTLEGSRNPDRDAQFEHINVAVLAMQAAGKPVISIDTKKKELVGDYKNAGSNYRPEGCPDKVIASCSSGTGPRRNRPPLRSSSRNVVVTDGMGGPFEAMLQECRK
jgi:Rhodopirellula transposase DDE domain